MHRRAHPPLRYVEALRRSHLARLAAVGAVALVPSACGNDDAEVFANATIPADLPRAATSIPTTTSIAPAVPTTVPDTATPETTTPDTATPETTTPDTATPDTTTPDTATPGTAVAPDPSDAAATIPATSEMVISFTYASDEAGTRSFRNPYVAVWVEDADGALVDTIGLWYETGSRRGTRYLDHLRLWWDASDGTIANSGATRPPGEYVLAWDGTDAEGNLVAAGDYVLVIEAAREDGPYSLTSTPITLGDAGFSVTLPDDVELAQLSATMTV